MSSLIFYTDQNQIYVATDTLAVHPNGEPMMFVSKATHIPHLNLIIAGTGQGGFANEFAFIVNSRMMLSGIENLNFHATNGLQKLWANTKANMISRIIQQQPCMRLVFLKKTTKLFPMLTGLQIILNQKKYHMVRLQNLGVPYLMVNLF